MTPNEQDMDTPGGPAPQTWHLVWKRGRDNPKLLYGRVSYDADSGYRLTLADPATGHRHIHTDPEIVQVMRLDGPEWKARGFSSTFIDHYKQKAAKYEALSDGLLTECFRLATRF